MATFLLNILKIYKYKYIYMIIKICELYKYFMNLNDFYLYFVWKSG